ncbi:hypothetical protein GYMLUDRAFT_52897 [Collybiopsis luxurians FD-317 M1]|nr:hypothetical protein GYMLUDRAFT_52897 [Collybiopsis luxurians FD-317 M1]
MRYSASASANDHFNDVVLTLRDEADGLIEDWGGLGETRKYAKIDHLEKAANSIEGLYVRWRELLDGAIETKVDIASLSQEASQTLFVLGEILERIAFALSNKNSYPLRHK